jgi:hypothetical protein
MEVFINGTQKTDGLSVGNGSHPNLTVRHGKIHHAIKFGKPSISFYGPWGNHGELLVITRWYI